MSTITRAFTKEQLIEQAKKNIEVLRGAVERIQGASDAAVIHLKLAEITLASLEADGDSEPVAFINGAWTLVYYRPPKELGLKIGDKLYTAPPAPVSVPDAATAIRACMEEFPESVHDIVEECAAIAESAFRAAMLNQEKSNG